MVCAIQHRIPDRCALPHLRDDYGVDVATLAANHLFDRGTPGFLQTLPHRDGTDGFFIARLRRS